MAKAGVWTGPEMLLQKSELLFCRTQQPNNHRFHYYTSTRAIEDFLIVFESRPIIYRKSEIYTFP